MRTAPTLSPRPRTATPPAAPVRPTPAPTPARPVVAPAPEPVQPGIPTWSHRFLPRTLRTLLADLGCWNNPAPQLPSTHLDQTLAVLQHYGWCRSQDVTPTGRMCIRGAQNLLEKTGHVTSAAANEPSPTCTRSSPTPGSAWSSSPGTTSLTSSFPPYRPSSKTPPTSHERTESSPHVRRLRRRVRKPHPGLDHDPRSAARTRPRPLRAPAPGPRAERAGQPHRLHHPPDQDRPHPTREGRPRHRRHRPRGGSLIGYQAHENNQVKAQEIALKAQALELQKLKEENRATQATEQTQTSQEKARQASIDKCVNRRDDKVGKSLGSPSYRDVIDACQAQYTGTASSADMQAAASTKATGGGVNQGVLIGGGVLAVFLVVAVKRGTRSNPA
ncbi:hypothetical protein ACFQ51_52135 [Streptomyces kaempferi]